MSRRAFKTAYDTANSKVEVLGKGKGIMEKGVAFLQPLIKQAQLKAIQKCETRRAEFKFEFQRPQWTYEEGITKNVWKSIAKMATNNEYDVTVRETRSSWLELIFYVD